MDKILLLIAESGISLFYLKIVLGFFISSALTFYTIPIIIKISHRKNLMDEPGVRSSHLRKIPNLGGIAIVYAITICASAFTYYLFDMYKLLFASLIILLYTGVMDDIVVMRAYKKLIAQLVVAVLMVVASDVRIGSLFGIFGIYELTYFASVIISILIFLFLINSFNLIDGIDGLAGTYSFLCSLFFGISYYRLGDYNFPLVILSAVIMGSVVGFLYYNLSNYRRTKIFMGDTGSMVLGFLLAFTATCFVNIFIDKHLAGVPRYHLQSAPAIAVAILILPIVDTINVIIIRLSQRRSPFDADKNHIHHKVVELGLTHRRATFYIILYYLLIVAVSYLLRHIEVNLLLMIILALGFVGAYLPNLILKLSNSKT